MKSRPLAWFALHGNRPFMAFDNPVHHGKPKATPFAHSFGREIGIEYSFHGG
jgi:hypothetical protein